MLRIFASVDFGDKENNQLKIEKLVIGNTYYIPHGTWNYKKGKLIEILDSKKVLLSDSKGKKFQCSINKLYTVPYKAVKGHKAKERVKQQMKKMEKKTDKSKLILN